MSHHVFRYTCREIIALHWHVMVGIIILYRALEEPTDKIMLHRQTNH